MKVIEGESQDRYGRYPIKFTGVKNLQEIVDWLHTHYQGYKFGMTFNCMGEESEEVGNEYWVYFLDEIADEVMSYIDFTEDKIDGKKIYRQR